VTAVNGNGTFRVDFDDGDVDGAVPKINIRKWIPAKQPAAAEAEATGRGVPELPLPSHMTSSASAGDFMTDTPPPSTTKSRKPPTMNTSHSTRSSSDSVEYHTGLDSVLSPSDVQARENMDLEELLALQEAEMKAAFDEAAVSQ